MLHVYLLLVINQIALVGSQLSSESIDQDIYEQMQSDAAPFMSDRHGKLDNFFRREEGNKLTHPISSRKNRAFIQLFHPHSHHYADVSCNGCMGQTAMSNSIETLFQIHLVSGDLALENFHTRRHLCIGETGVVYTEPSDKASSNKDCRLTNVMAERPDLSIADKPTISSKHYSNQSHALTLSLDPMHIWRAEWLNISDPAPPQSMVFTIVKVEGESARKKIITGSSHQPCTSNQNHAAQTSIGSAHCNWDIQFRFEHAKCGADIACIGEIYSKCLDHGRNILGLDVKPLTDCIFSKKSNKCWKLRRKSDDFKQCLATMEKTCKKTLKEASSSRWSKRKVSRKCKIKVKVEKCMNRKLKSIRRKKSSVKKARCQCKKRFSKSAKKPCGN